jgi:hypothetical protein
MNEARHQHNEIPKDVRDFAHQKGVVDHLPAILELTRRVFPGGEPTLQLHHDPELPETWILFFRSDETEFTQLLKAHRAWRAGLQEVHPGLGPWFVYRVEQQGP